MTAEGRAVSIQENQMSTNCFAFLPHNLQTSEYRGHHVASLSAIDILHQRSVGSAKWQFLSNIDRYDEERDYFTISGNAPSRAALSSTSDLSDDDVVLTATGYAKVIRFWDDDISWRQWEALYDLFSSTKGTAT